MITVKEFKKQIAKPFGQTMRVLGFKGTGFEYFQDSENFLFSIYIDPSRWGGSCSIGYAIHPKQVDRNYKGKLDLATIKKYQYEFRMGFKKSWGYSDDELENLITLSEIVAIIKENILPVIDKFKAKPSFLDQFEIDEMSSFHKNWMLKTGASIATTDDRFAWAMVMIYQNTNLHKAKQFANWALAKINDSDWFGMKDFYAVTNRKEKEFKN